MSTDTRIWHHIIITTYGAWLHGDARGFRTRHHREHVDGDYNSPPPPGAHADRERRSRESLLQDPVTLPLEWRPRVGRALWQEFTKLGAWVLAMAVAGKHVHLLVKLPPNCQRQWTGRAKRSSTLALRDRGWKGKVWAVRSKAVVIRDRAQQRNTFEYILRHVNENAWIGVWRTEGVDGATRDG